MAILDLQDMQTERRAPGAKPEGSRASKGCTVGGGGGKKSNLSVACGDIDVG